jgi:hypothetical protein
VEFGEWLCEEVLKAVPHRHFVFSIPKILRRYFLYDRKLLSGLSRCGWDSLKEFFREIVPEDGAVSRPGGIIAIQTFGDFLRFNPHLHVLCFPRCAGLLWRRHVLRVAPRFTTKTLEEIFRHKVFKMLLSKGKITEDLVDMLLIRTSFFWLGRYGIWNCVPRKKRPQHLWGKAGLGLEVFQRDDLKRIRGFNGLNLMGIGIIQAQS